MHYVSVRSGCKMETTRREKPQSDNVFSYKSGHDFEAQELNSSCAYSNRLLKQQSK